MDKVTRVLMLYHRLLNGQYIDKALFSVENNINERTFDRDVEDIRLFLSEIYSSEELLFDKTSNAYYLSGQRLKYLDRMDVTVVAKLVLENKSLRKDEMIELLNVLLSVVSVNDADAIKDYLKFEIKSYESTTRNAILKFIGDLYAVLKLGYDIEIEFENEEIFVENISPLKVTCNNKMFYLIAARNFDLNEIIKIPVEKIIRFKKLNTIYSKSLQEKYYKTKEE